MAKPAYVETIKMSFICFLRPAIFNGEMDWEHEKERYIHLVKKHMNDSPVAAHGTNQLYKKPWRTTLRFFMAIQNLVLLFL